MVRHRRPSGESERGSAPAEFALVAGLLALLTLSVLQLALALHVRNTALDAAAEGARIAALADSGLAEGEQRTRDLLVTALSAGYARQVDAAYRDVEGTRTVEVTVVFPLPVLGLVGFERGLEVRGHAAVEAVD
ncbi:TadE/TadG family type IV pilus assembly protein [Microbacteriaceae bacterium 4G12]